ncbi:MAG: glycosyltransferase family 4 protein [Gammaproteobacteria bacterium]|nr:glycosyltransferase family 4 protein [Gammaproteobacteria bacterium]
MNKLVFVNRYFFPDSSATSQLLSDLAFELSGAGCTVYVVTSRQLYHDPNADLTPSESINGVNVARVWSSHYGRKILILRALDYFSFYISACVALLSMLGKGDVVIAKTDPPLLSLAVWPVAVLRGARVVNWLQDVYPDVAQALNVAGVKYLAPLLKWMRNLTLKHATVNVVIGENMASLLEGEGVQPRKIQVIHNWIDGGKIVPQKEVGRGLREEWNLDSRFVVGYSGNMGRVHDFATIISAIKTLASKVSDISFLFVGAGAREAFIKEELRGIPNVLFKPHQPFEKLSESLGVPDVHLVSLLPEMEGLIVPSKFYGIAAAGRPVIFVGSRTGEIAKIIGRSKCGYAVPSGDSASLADCIESIYWNREDGRRRGGEARKLFDSEFNRDIAMRKWKEVLGIAHVASL